MKTSYKLYIILIGALILFSVGLFNGYALIYPDSATYIHSGFDFFIPRDRPIFYGLFVRLFSLNYSLWTVILIQNLIQSWLLLEVCLLFFSSKRAPFYFIIITAFLTFFTSIAWYTNQIMPDFSAPIIAMVLFLMVYSPSVSIIKQIVYSLIILLSNSIHLSHLLIASSVIFFIVIFEFWNYKKKTVFYLEIKRRNIIIAVFVVLISWIIIPSMNYMIGNKYELSKGSHVFLMAHFADNGTLKKFLNENCDKEEYRNCKLCQYKDSLPTNLNSFLWEANSVFYKTGGWENSKEEYTKIINGIKSKPKYIFFNMYKSLLYSGTQLTRNDIGSGLIPFPKGTEQYGQISWRFKNELNDYENSRQNTQYLRAYLNEINKFNFWINICSLFGLLLIAFSGIYKRMDLLSVKLLGMFGIAVLFNAFFTAGISAPSERYQARINWLIVLAVLIVVVKNFGVLKSALKELLRKE